MSTVSTVSDFKRLIAAIVGPTPPDPKAKRGQRGGYAHPLQRHPLVDDNQPGYIPTVEVMSLVAENFSREYIATRVERERFGYPKLGEIRFCYAGIDYDAALYEAMAVEMACRTLLATRPGLYK